MPITVDSHARLQLWIMLTLTFATGIADAVGYLALDKVFTGNMTGNVVILGMGLGGAEELPVLGPTIALIAFMGGAAAAGRVLRNAKGPWPPRLTALLLAVSVALWVAVAGLAFLALDQTANQTSVAALIATAMGAQAAAARFVAVKDVTTVVVTSTITGLAADSRLGASSPQPWSRRLAAILLIGAGALAGAFSLQISPWCGMAGAAALSTAAAVIAHLVAARISLPTND